MPEIHYSLTMSQQMERMGRGELDELAVILRSFRFETRGRDPHRLQGFGAQSLLEGAYAQDFRTGDGRGRWRLLYDWQDDNNILLLGILDYHGGGAIVPLWGLGRNMDLTDN
jgi:hypothetical protein